MDKRISDLDAVVSVNPIDVLPIVNSGVTKKVQVSQLRVDTDLSYIASPTNGKVRSSTSSTPIDATIPLADVTNAGLLSSAEKALIASIPSLSTNIVLKDTVKLNEAIAKGQAVYISGATGTNILVDKASNDSEARSSRTMGLAETGGSQNDIVNIVTNGILGNLNTIGSQIGDDVWLGNNGNLLYGVANKPSAPLATVHIGVVSRVHVNVGEIYVSVVNGFELDELHNVSIAGGLEDNDALCWNDATDLWKPKRLIESNANATVNGTSAWSTNIFNQKVAETAEMKSLSSFSFRANNTNSANNSASFVFKNITNQPYTGVITFSTGTQPSGITNHFYSFSQIGNMVTFSLMINFGTAGGTALTTMVCEIPTDVPLPLIGSGLGAASDLITYGIGGVNSNLAIPTALATLPYCGIRIKSTGIGMEIVTIRSTGTLRTANMTFQYFV